MILRTLSGEPNSWLHTMMNISVSNEKKKVTGFHFSPRVMLLNFLSSRLRLCTYCTSDRSSAKQSAFVDIIRREALHNKVSNDKVSKAYRDNDAKTLSQNSGPRVNLFSPVQCHSPHMNCDEPLLNDLKICHRLFQRNDKNFDQRRSKICQPLYSPTSTGTNGTFHKWTQYGKGNLVAFLTFVFCTEGTWHTKAENMINRRKRHVISTLVSTRLNCHLSSTRRLLFALPCKAAMLESHIVQHSLYYRPTYHPKFEN